MKKFPFFVLQELGNKKETEITFRKLQEDSENQLFLMFIKQGKILTENEQMSANGKGWVFECDSQQSKYNFHKLVP